MKTIEKICYWILLSIGLILATLGTIGIMTDKTIAAAGMPVPIAVGLGSALYSALYLFPNNKTLKTIASMITVGRYSNTD
jgi:hypothetical protein